MDTEQQAKQRKWFSLKPQIICLIAVACCVSAFGKDWMETVLGPSVVEIRAAADKGDPVAQYKLGVACQRHLDPTYALPWFKKSARQGYADAQCAVGNILIGNEYPLSKTSKEGLRWLLLAANQNCVQAQTANARLYERGKIIPLDRVEAFKWYTLATKQQGIHRVYLDALVFKMTAAETTEGEKRAAAFRIAPPEPILPEVKLQSISGVGTKRLAMINGHTFAARETANVKAEEETLSIKCLEIGDGLAIVEVNGNRQTLTMSTR